MSEAALPRLLEVFPESAELGKALRRAGYTVAVAESCTGGLLGAALTAVPGSSAYMRGGVIAYADDVKCELLDVERDVLREHGAVSEEVALQMARGVRSRLQADWGLAITGVAGPFDESSSKLAGLIFVAVASHGDHWRMSELTGDHGREGNRVRAVREALRLCRQLV